MEQIVIPARFNGPPASGNGGYSCGAVARFIDGAARVRLHAPPPLDTALDVESAGDGRVEVRHGETLIASGGPAVLSITPPKPPTLAAAEQGRSTYPYLEEHVFPTCFVCGTGRPEGDGLELFTGPVGDDGLFACSWRPAPDLLDESGQVRSEFVWSALDCPGCFGALGDAKIMVLLGELLLEQYAPVPGDEDLIVYAWPEGSNGRKHYGGAAIANQAGEVLACSLTTWIAIDQLPQA